MIDAKTFEAHVTEIIAAASKICGDKSELAAALAQALATYILDPAHGRPNDPIRLQAFTAIMEFLVQEHTKVCLTVGEHPKIAFIKIKAPVEPN